MHCGEGAFGSDDEFDEIELSVSNEFIQVVPADAPHDLGITAFDFITVVAHDFRDTRFQTASPGGLFAFHFAKSSSLA